MNKPKIGESFSDIQTFYNRAKRDSKGWHDKIIQRRKFYNEHHYSNPPAPNEERYTDPTYVNAVDLGVGILLGNEMEWKATGWRPGSEEQSDSSRIEKYLAALIELNSEREEMVIQYEVLLHFLRDGCAILYSVWDDVIDQASQITVPYVNEDGSVTEMSAFAESPLRLQVIDPLNVFLRAGGPRRWSQVFHVQKMSVYDAEQKYHVSVERYRTLSDLQKMDVQSDLISMWQVSDQIDIGLDGVVTKVKPAALVQNAIIYAGTLVQPLKVMAGYDSLPFTVAFFKPVERGSSDNWTQSIIDPLQHTIQFLERSINRRAQQITKYSGTPLVVKSSRTNVAVDQGLTNSIQINPDEDVQYPQWAGNPPDVRDQIEFFRARAQQSGFSDIMFGSAGSSASGYALSQLGDQNRIRLEQPVIHLERMWGMWAKKALKLTANFAAGFVIQMYGRFRGTDFAEQLFDPDLANYNVRAEIKPEFPNEKVRKHAMATQVKGIISEDRLMHEYLDVDQPDDERRRKIQEMAETHPMVIQYHLLAELIERARRDDMAAIMALQMMQGGGGGGQPMPAQRPSAPEQLMGTPSPTGQPTQQEQGGMPAGQAIADQLAQIQQATPSAVTGGLE